jgi:leucine efflux protein
MVHIQNYGSFIMAVAAFQIIPGAGTITILNATARKGPISGLKAVWGTLLGDFIYMLAAVLGLAAILSAYPRVLDFAQWLGIACLCGIGLKLLCASRKDERTAMAMKHTEWACFRQALAVSLTNPKVIMFFMAFFPMFLNTTSSPITLFILMIHVTAISFLYQTCLVLVGHAVARKLSRWEYVCRVAPRLAGVALIGFGVKLVVAKR